jgi:hypothetical protein
LNFSVGLQGFCNNAVNGSLEFAFIASAFASLERA